VIKNEVSSQSKSNRTSREVLEAIEKLVAGAFSMDTLGIKDKTRSAGLSKFYKKDISDWSPKEKEIDDKIVVTLVPMTETTPQHYTAKVPWKNGHQPDLISNMEQVRARQNRTCNSGYLESKGTSMEAIDEIFKDYFKKGYIEQVTDETDKKRKDCHYINFFPVVHKDRDTTKVRIVFDAASYDKQGKSVNSEIEKTPNRLNDLFAILLGFREYEYALQADISEMFLRIKMCKEDFKYHRFFWRDEVWQWTSEMFGGRACPDISQKVICTHAEKFEIIYPLASYVIINKTYMDDSITSKQTEEELVELAHQLIPLMDSMNMKIMKFYSNSKKLVKSLDPTLLSKKVTFGDKDPILEESKVLGMHWDADKDIIRYVSKFKDVEAFFKHLNITKNPVWTKRLILKLSATVYDPLGLISPYTVKARSILQELWKCDLTWDQPIPEEFAKRWQSWLDELFVLAENISIPRWLKCRDDRRISLHVFTDASSRVYCCAAYLRVTAGVTSRGGKDIDQEDDEIIDVLLVTAKSRVAPTKTESISRLELAGCVLGVRLGNAVADAFHIKPEKVNYWTDSTNCLFWITSPSSVSKTFVSNRVGEIQNESEQSKWRHVPTEQNPADVPTRFPKVDDLKKSDLWWNGPDFLRKGESQWPPKFVPTPDDAGKEEMKKEYANFRVFVEPKIAPTLLSRKIDPKNFSVDPFQDGYKQLLRNTATYIGCINVKLINSERMQRALQFQVRRSQHAVEELDELMSELRETDVTKNTLLSLSPYIDARGILRSKTRLVDIDYLPYNARCPMILSTKSTFTQLLVQSYHKEFEHGVSVNTVKSKLRDSFHILGLENYLRSLRTTCRTCIVKNAKASEQKIANLPEFRFEQPLGAFAKTGIDFAGPYEIKKGRMQARPKYYILLFTCLQTRAVHLEVTPGMDTDAVVLAFTRFIAYRGMPTDFLSDNWSTFVSDDKELEGWVRNLNQQDIISKVSAAINWHLTPPYGPHHGGTYEIMIKATKRCLKSFCRHPDFTLDEFQTFVARAASMLNGRPITKVVEDGESMILTPNHFLIGNLGGAVSTARIDNPVKRWQKVLSQLKAFWKTFLSEYIVELGRARKWKKISKNLLVGDLVLEIDPNTDSGNWSIALVKEILPSKDGLVRKVVITTNGRDYIRPITRLSPLYQNFG
jgi:hypothetical protein